MVAKNTTAKRKPQTRAKTNTRPSRAQETRKAEDVHEMHGMDWEEGSTLTAPDARPGYYQRWVRTKLRGEDDPRDMIVHLNRGYRPRAADTIPKGMFAQTVAHGDYGNVIGTFDMILMEVPLEIHERQQAKVREDTRTLQHHVDHTLGEVHSPNDKGFTAPEVDRSSTVTKGRPVQVADD